MLACLALARRERRALQGVDQNALAAIGTLPGPIVRSGPQFLVGSWRATTFPANTLLSSMVFDSGPGDGDECGGSAPYRLLEPSPEPALGYVGVSLMGSYGNPRCS